MVERGSERPEAEGTGGFEPWGGARESAGSYERTHGQPLEPAPVVEAAAGFADDPELRRLDPRWITLRRVGMLARTFFFSVGALVAELLIDSPVPSGALATAVAVIGSALTVFLPPAQHRAWGFRVRAEDLFVTRGVLWRAASVIPHARIQHVDTQSGPLERGLGLAQVVIYTAGIRGADITIPGLPQADAEALRDNLAELGGLHDGV